MTEETWRDEQRIGLDRGTEKAQSLVGRTIDAAEVKSHDPDCDAENVLVLTMSDGTVWEVVGGYGSYTGHSCDEYIELVYVRPGVQLGARS